MEQRCSCCDQTAARAACAAGADGSCSSAVAWLAAAALTTRRLLCSCRDQPGTVQLLITEAATAQRPLSPHAPKPRLPLSTQHPHLPTPSQLRPSPFNRVNPPVLMLHGESRVHTRRMTASISITPLCTLPILPYHPGGVRVALFHGRPEEERRKRDLKDSSARFFSRR